MTKNAFILNFFKFYNILWMLGLPFLKRNKRLASGFDQRIYFSHHSKADLWIQAASAGEAYLAIRLIKGLVPKQPLKILVSATTSQGMDILHSNLRPRSVHPQMDVKIEWFPFDMPRTIKGAVNRINPRVMVLLETEIWPSLFYCLKQNRTKIFIVNARLSKKSYRRYRKTRFLWKHLEPDRVLATSGQNARRYQDVFKTARVATMPNIKFEAMHADVPDAALREQFKNILCPALPLTILASIRQPEEKECLCILKTILTSFPGQVVAVFPRHMNRIRAWATLLKTHGLDFQLRSTIKACQPGPKIILWDTFGELKTAYGFASVVFVGGSLKPLGGQNFIEPAVHGAVTVTGPFYDDFAWAADDLFERGIVVRQDHWTGVAQTIVTALKTPRDRSRRKQVAQNYIRSNSGGTAQACHEILKAFDEQV